VDFTGKTWVGNHRWPEKPHLGLWGDLIRGLCVSEDKEYVGTKDGIYVVPLTGGESRLIGEAEGLPASTVQALAYLAGKVYAALDGGYLVAYVPTTKQCDVLASSRRRDERSPFDNTEAFQAFYMIADPERDRILFSTSARSRDRNINGFWEFNSRSKRFVRHIEMNSYPGDQISSIHGGQVAISRLYGLINFDLDKNRAELVWSRAPEMLGRMRLSAALTKEFSTSQPYARRGDYVWTGSPFGRIHLREARFELLPAFLNGRKAGKYASECLEPVGDGHQLLVGNPEGLWLLDLRTN
jgi:hypothetical protein